MKRDNIIIVPSGSPTIPFEEATGQVFRPLTNDLLFHVVLQNNNEALKSLICSLLSLRNDEIKKVRLLNPICYGQHINTKVIVLDSKVLLNNDTEINIEIQNHNEDNWNDRAVYYACRNCAGLKTGEEYTELKPFYQIGIIDFDLPGKSNEFYARYELCNISNPEERFNSKFKLSVLSLTQMDKATRQDIDSGLLQWAKLFKATSWDEIKSLSDKYPELKEVAQTMYTASAEDQIRYEMEMREKGERDRRWLINNALRKGKAEGKEEGKAEEYAIAKQIIHLYFKENKSLEEIAVALEVPLEKVKGLVE